MNETIKNIDSYLEKESEKEYKIYHLESKKDNILNGLKTYEEINIELYNLLIDSSLIDIEKQKENEKWIYKTNKLQLEKYIKNKDKENDRILVIYEKNNNMTYGRCNPKKSLGLHNIARYIRHTLTKEIYIDIDVENCHPSILYQISLKSKMKLKFLEEYVKKRDEIYNKYIDFYGLEKDDIKKLFIRLLYFGNFENWIEDIKKEDIIIKNENNENEKRKKKLKIEDKDDFIIGFIKDINLIGSKIYDYNDEIKEEVKKNKDDKFIKQYNKKGSIVSFYLQEIESQILETIYKYCVKEKYIEDNNCVLCADGLMIKKDKYNEKILLELNKLILDKFGYNLIFKQKEMDGGYSKEKLKNNKQDYIQYFKLLSYNGTDKYFAKLYYEEYGKYKYLYSNKLGWFEYDDYNKLKNYGKEKPPSLINHISDSLTSLIKNKFFNVDVSNENYNDIHRIYVGLYKHFGTSKKINGMMDFLKSYYVEDDFDDLIDKNMNLISFKNKVYDVSEKRFRDIKKSDYISRNTGYLINENNNDDIQKDIDDILWSIFENKEIINYWLLTTASSLITNKFEHMMMNIGEGGNGKGLLSSLIKSSFGDYFYQTPNTFLTIDLEKDGPNSTLANCNGRRYVLVTEPDNKKDCKFNIAFIKSLTGRDQITTRELFKTNITFKPTFTLYLQANDIPKLNKIDEGIVRRLKMINYPFKFVDNPSFENERKKNYNLKDKLESKNYINQFMLYLIKIIENNFDEDDEYKKIEMPELCKEKINEYIDDNNPLKNFIESNLIKTNNINDKIKISDLYNLYNEKGFKNISSQAKLIDLLKFNKINSSDIYKSNGLMILKNYKIKEEENKDLFDDNNNSKKINVLDM